MMENRLPDMTTAEVPEPTPIFCPVCKKIIGAIVAPDMTGWLRCSYNHKTTYRNGVPVQTTKNGNPIWAAF